MPRKRRSCFSSILIVVFVFTCLGAVSFFLGLEGAPRLAEPVFGAPSTGLDRFQKAYYALQLLFEKDSLTVPVDVTGKTEQLKIEEGESVNSIANKLEAAGLVRDAAAFRLFLIYSGLDKGIKSGSYELSPAKNAVEIAHAIQDPTPGQATLNILAGWRMEEVAAALPYTGLLISPDDFIGAASRFDGFATFYNSAEITGVEGFLFPGEYHLVRTASSADLLALIQSRFTDQVTQDILDGFNRQGLSLYEGVILASIVQKEAIVDEELPIIASVFLNRLKKNIRLESDPTVQYALGYFANKKTWWKNPLSADDLKVNSPYNTYVIPGLPPRPISNPGLSALRAVAFSAQTPYYYFRARCDGSGRHSFSATYEEHLNNGCP